MMTEEKKEYKQFTIYKTKGAFQMNFDSKRNRVFINCAASIGERKYNWQTGKVVMMLGISDILPILYGISKGVKEAVKIIHKTDTTTSGLQIVAAETGYFLNSYVKKGDVTTQADVSLTSQELLGLKLFLEAAFQKMTIED